MTRSKGIAISYIHIALRTIVGLFLSAFIIRILGDTEYGIYQNMTAFATYLALFEMGTGTIMTRNIAMNRGKDNSKIIIDRNISTVALVTLVLTVIIVAASIVFYFSVDTIYKKSMTGAQIIYGKRLFVFVTIGLIFNFVTQTLNGILLGYEDYTTGTILSIVYLGIRSGLVILMLLLSPSSLGLVWIDTAVSGLITLITYGICKRRYHIKVRLCNFDSGVFREMLPLALALLLQNIVNMANGNVDKFVIGVLINPETVTLYSVAMYIYQTFSSLTTVPISMYMPQIAREMSEGKRGRELTEILVQPCRFVSIIGGLILFGFLAAGKSFIYLIYGSGFDLAWTCAMLIMVPMYINMCNGVIVNVLDVLRKRHVRSISLSITTLLNIILTVLWIKKYGIIGASAATAVATILGQIIVMNIYYAKKINISILYLFRKSFSGILPVLLLACALSWGVGVLFKGDATKFFVCGTVFCAVFGAGFMEFGANKYEKKIIMGIVAKFRKK